MLREKGAKFRVLGLSATPGKDRGQVQEVISNLLIARVLHRREDDPDVAPFTHPRRVETRLVKPSSSLFECREQLVGVLTQVRAPEGISKRGG